MSAPAQATFNVNDVLSGTDAEFNDDLNGACFIAGAEGEPEILVENNIVLFPKGMATVSDAEVGNAISHNSNTMAAFLLINTLACLKNGRSEDQAVRIAYLRFLSARTGLISPSFSTQVHNVRYNHAKFIDETETQILAGTKTTYAIATKALKEKLHANIRKEISPKFTNLVCCVAYMFRVRGHHYMADFNDRYITLWSRCLYKPEELPLDWQFVATDALHAIMPDVLDEFWRNAADNARCAGTLIKRIDSAPAGAAGVVALERGLNDVTMLFPAIVEKVPDSYNEFKAVVAQTKTSRWACSINARFYGVSRARVDEAKIGALASVVLGVYEHLAPASKLRDSMALQRLAQIAPVTGGAIGIAAGRAARDDRLNLISYTVAGPPTVEEA